MAAGEPEHEFRLHAVSPQTDPTGNRAIRNFRRFYALKLAEREGLELMAILWIL